MTDELFSYQGSDSGFEGPVQSQLIGGSITACFYYSLLLDDLKQIFKPAVQDDQHFADIPQREIIPLRKSCLIDTCPSAQLRKGDFSFAAFFN